VILKYYDEEARELQELKEIPENVKINEGGFDLEEGGLDEEEKEEDDLDIDLI
jgi:hypothetical protein